MKLANAILRPGKVLEVLENGDILAEVSGLFSSQDKDNLPPIRPMFHGAENCYSQPKKYQEVWVLNMLDNPQQLYWFRKDNILEKNSNIINETNVEIICNREAGLGWATIYFSDGSGWVIQKDSSIIQIREDGSIVLKTDWPNRSIEITTDGISLGSEGGSSHPAACGDKVEEIFGDMLTMFNSIYLVAMTNPYTMAIANTIKPQIQKMQDKIGLISSQHVTID